MIYSWRSQHRSDAGVAMVEFALCLLPLSIIVFGTIDLGRAFITYEHVKNAAREGAYLAASQPYHQYNVVGAAVPCVDNIWTRVLQESGSAAADLALTITVTPSGGAPTTYSSLDNSLVCGTPTGVTPSYGPKVKVLVQDNRFTLLTPVMQNLLGPIQIKSSVTVVEQQ